MAFFSLTKSVLSALLILTLANSSAGARPRKLDLWIPDTDLLTYHNGGVLQGNIPVSIIWYGYFSWAQKSIITDFLLSLTYNQWEPNPSVAQWWSTIDQLYLSKVGNNNKRTKVTLAHQSDNWYQWGKYLTMSQIAQLASHATTPKGGITLVFTAQDVAVENFCMNHCAVHGSDQSSGTTFIWVGNSENQCPGQCAWPFHQPEYGPQTPPLLPPNGDLGIDGMVMNLASMFAGTATNPFGNGYYQGPQEAPMEACTACPGVYGKGAYPGFPGHLLIDSSTGASYNANGFSGRKYVLPAIFDPTTSSCLTLN
ncbi:Protein EXORDIUM [Rhynchospora pubera]|uniref:Protein EXORDIUM n=1 Tax=Rhynchospora pubera TaxID=906938 RepID=A0AAV8CRM6_9POAL|nr:Protein EXORDIUM [Rhynchospora pubera]